MNITKLSVIDVGFSFVLHMAYVLTAVFFLVGILPLPDDLGNYYHYLFSTSITYYDYYLLPLLNDPRPRAAEQCGYEGYSHQTNISDEGLSPLNIFRSSAKKMVCFQKLNNKACCTKTQLLNVKFAL